MSYRSADAAVRERIEGVTAEIADLDAQIAALTAELAGVERETYLLRERIERDGPGGGYAGASILRIPVILGSLSLTGVLVIPFQLYLGGFVGRQPREAVLPLLFLGGPAALSSVIAWGYRDHGAFYRKALVGGFSLLVLLLVILLLGLGGAGR